MALARAHNENNDREFGLLVGYPITAVDAFLGNQPRIEHEDLPKEIQSSEYFHFLEFVLSKDHWQEEIETVKRQAEIVQKVAPAFYQNIISRPIK